MSVTRQTLPASRLLLLAGLVLGPMVWTAVACASGYERSEGVETGGVPGAGATSLREAPTVTIGVTDVVVYETTAVVPAGTSFQDALADGTIVEVVVDQRPDGALVHVDEGVNKRIVVELDPETVILRDMLGNHE